VSITVATPAPCAGAVAGFCVSEPRTLTITPSVGPIVNVTPTSGAQGTVFTATLTNWAGGAQDWLGIVPAGALDTSYVTFVWVASLPGSGSVRTWTITLPLDRGTYDVGLFFHNTFVRGATSPTFTVTSPPGP